MQRARRLPLDSVWILWQAAIIGVAGGLLGVVFREIVTALSRLVMPDGAPVDPRLSIAETLLIPAAGAAIAGLLLALIRNQRGPFGIGDVVELAVTRRGTIRTPRSLVQIASSAFSIASGGSIGREGANSQFGATVAAVLGRRFPNSRRSRVVLIGCGIAAGMASAYKAPIAAAIFVMEVVLGNFAMDVLAPLVVASVISTLITVAWYGHGPLYEIGSDLTLLDWRLVLSALVLGAMCGFGGIAFRKALDLGAAAFGKLPLPLVLRMTIGGLLVGAIGVFHPEVWGNGQTTIEVIADIDQRPGLLLLASLLFWKVIATAITSGSGALGGVFTPNLVVGAAFGAAFARVVDSMMPGSDHHTEFALVGMAGLCAATAHAPITAIMLVFEMTGNYGLILPLMLCSIIASVTARMLDEDSIYTARLRRRGLAIHEGLEELAIHQNFVRDITRSGPAKVAHTASFEDVLDVFHRERVDTVYVVDGTDRLLGLIHLHDVKQFINDPTLGTVVIAGDLTRPGPVALPDETLAQILERFDDPDLDELPVVHDRQDSRLIGRVTRRDLVACLSEEVLGGRKLRAKLKLAGQRDPKWVEMPAGVVLARLPVPVDLIGRAIESLDLIARHGVHLFLLVQRDALGREERLLPRPELVLAEGMELIAFGTADDLATFRRLHGLDGDRDAP